ncbi:hypothetical protein [Mesorhizobium shangrilense]|uniref:Uncharacterized protein n=1 Tax=Mesorhizobium shangrilense TaxID=460060 RepID=A0ABV2DM60_9HYPH
MGRRSLAGNGFGNRNSTTAGEIQHLALRKGVAHAAAGEDQRPLGRRQRRDGIGDRGLVGALARNAMHCAREECFRIIESIS